MTITLKKEVEETIEIPVPCFLVSKDEKSWIGLLDENTVVEIYVSNGYKSIVNSELWIKQNSLNNAWKEFHSCTETAFFKKYDQVVESMSLHPILVP